MNKLLPPIIFVLALFAVYNYILPAYERKVQEKEAKKINAQIADMMNLKYNEFVSDTLNGFPINDALDIIEYDSISNNAAVVKSWAKSNNVNLDSFFLIRQVKYKMIENKIKSEINNSSFSSVPKDGMDEKAFIIAKDIIKQNLKSPSTSKFAYEYMVRFSPSKFYTISSTVEAKNSFGVLINHNWSVDLKYKGSGDWTDNENWESKNIIITEK